MSAYIHAVGTAVPPFRFAQEEVKDAVRRMFDGDMPRLERLLSIFENSGIADRHFCAELEWFVTPHTAEEKHRLFVTHATELAERAARQCLERAGIEPRQIDHVIVVNTTGTVTPSLDAYLLNRLGFSPRIKRSPIWGLGCAGGAAGLSRASEYIAAFPSHRCLLISVELCSLTFVRDDASKSNIVATSLFADGAAAALITGTPGHSGGRPRIAATQSTTWPDSLDVMGWDMTNDGMKVIFSRDIPTLVKQYMLSNVEELLIEQGVPLSQIAAFVLHPGGRKVLEAYEEALELPREALSASSAVLHKYGNMSSCTVLFVLEETMRRGIAEGAWGIAGALGPGFSSELLLLQF